jgi:tetratricopeptide (TPR) repeat protein
LLKVIDEYPDFAEAYALLGWARLIGGGSNSAIEAMKTAIQLSPRNESYQLRLAETYVAMKKWDEATAVLEGLKASQDSKIAGAAKKELNDLPFLKKFGVPPQQDASKQEVITANTQKRNELDDEEEDQQAKPAEQAAEPGVDKRPVHFMRATLVAVDCAQAPAAVVTVTAENRTLKLRTEDYKNLAVIATQTFSCDWKNMAVSINYKRGGRADGDLVSIEVR